MNSKQCNEIIELGKKKLKQDEYFCDIIKSQTTPKLNLYKDPFLSLIKYICYQQLSIIAAKSIYGKFINLFNGNTISPKKVIDIILSKFLVHSYVLHASAEHRHSHSFEK